MKPIIAVIIFGASLAVYGQAPTQPVQPSRPVQPQPVQPNRPVQPSLPGRNQPSDQGRQPERTDLNPNLQPNDANIFVPANRPPPGLTNFPSALTNYPPALTNIPGLPP